MQLQSGLIAEVAKLKQTWNDWDSDYTVDGSVLVTLLATLEEQIELVQMAADEVAGMSAGRTNNDCLSAWIKALGEYKSVDNAAHTWKPRLG